MQQYCMSFKQRYENKTTSQLLSEEEISTLCNSVISEIHAFNSKLFFFFFFFFFLFILFYKSFKLFIHF